jgi:hypothetical protein
MAGICNNRTLMFIKDVIYRIKHKIMPKQKGGEFFIQIEIYKGSEIHLGNCVSAA